MVLNLGSIIVFMPYPTQNLINGILPSPQFWRNDALSFYTQSFGLTLSFVASEFMPYSLNNLTRKLICWFLPPLQILKKEDFPFLVVSKAKRIELFEIHVIKLCLFTVRDILKINTIRNSSPWFRNLSIVYIKW